MKMVAVAAAAAAAAADDDDDDDDDDDSLRNLSRATLNPLHLRMMGFDTSLLSICISGCLMYF